MYKGILVRCNENEVCEASEVHNMTPWQLVKSLSKCEELTKEQGGICRMAVAYDQETHTVLNLDRTKFNY